MSTNIPIIISSPNLSHAWGMAFLNALHRSKRDLCPLVLSIGDFPPPLPPEDAVIKDKLNDELLRLEKYPCDVSAMTIFPYKPWVRRGMPACDKFCDFCLNRFLPRIKERDHRNQYGTYFARMMAYEGTRSNGPRVVNQIEFVINLLRNSARRPRASALQIACFDAAKDHTGQPVRGFPCLQQVSVGCDDEGGIAINAYYPTQYIFDRAYGNYLGLCHLGHFIAHETGLKFVRFNCFIGRPELGDVNKRDVQSLAALISSRIAPDAQMAVLGGST